MITGAVGIFLQPVPQDRLGSVTRDGEIIEARGPDGSPPFMVRWADGGTTLVFPGPDAQVHPPAAAQN